MAGALRNLGYLVTDTSVRDTVAALRQMKQLGVRGEWERYRFDALGSKSNADMYSVGLNYKF